MDKNEGEAVSPEKKDKKMHRLRQEKRFRVCNQMGGCFDCFSLALYFFLPTFLIFATQKKKKKRMKQQPQQTLRTAKDKKLQEKKHVHPPRNFFLAVIFLHFLES